MSSRRTSSSDDSPVVPPAVAQAPQSPTTRNVEIPQTDSPAKAPPPEAAPPTDEGLTEEQRLQEAEKARVEADEKANEMSSDEPTYEPDDPARYGAIGKRTKNDRRRVLAEGYSVFANPEDTEAMVRAGVPLAEIERVDKEYEEAEKQE